MIKLTHTMKRLNTEYFKNLMFGVEDSLVSTVGVLFGMASSASVNQKQLLLAGFIVISVEAVSMGAGAFLTESSVQEMDNKRKYKDSSFIDGLIMFFSYFIAGFVPISAYLLLKNIETAKYASLILTFTALFILGYLPTKRIRAAFRMTLVAGMAASTGFLVAEIFKQI